MRKPSTPATSERSGEFPKATSSATVAPRIWTDDPNPHRRKSLKRMVGSSGLEPETSTVSR